MQKIKLTFILMSLAPLLMAGTAYFDNVKLSEIYIPTGFDKNDEAQIVITGHLPNLCEDKPIIKIKKDGTDIFIDVTTRHYEGNIFCPDALNPFTEVVSLGHLDEGYYQLYFNRGTSNVQHRQLVVSDNNSLVDESQSVAFVSEVEIEDNNQIKIKGHKLSYCYSPGSVKILSNGENTYSLVPVLNKETDFCPNKLTPVEYSINMPEGLDREEILLHVKSLSGQGVNKIISK